MSERKLPIGSHISKMAQHWPEAWAQTNPAALLLYRCREHLFNDYLAALEPHGIPSAEFEVLCTLRSSAPPFEMTPTEIYRGLLFSSGGLTKVLSRLTERGLVTRHANPADGRGQLVRLSEAGRELVEASIGDVCESEAKMLSALDEDEQAQLARLLEKALAARE